MHKKLLIIFLIAIVSFVNCDLGKSDNEKIQELQNEIVKKQKALEDCWMECEKKDELIVEWREKYNQLKEECENTPEPSPNNQAIKSLSIQNGRIYVNGKETKLAGVSRWEALWRTTNEHGCADWGDYSLEWYEKQLIESGINYVRHGGIKNTELMYQHCKRMKEAGIVVEVTVYRAGNPQEGVLVNLSDMKRLHGLGNVFFDVNNEFSGNEAGYKKSIEVAGYLKNQGCLISGGAWWNAEGKKQSEKFLKLGLIDILTHHRNWNEVSFSETMLHGMPVVQNEYFAFKENLSLQQVKDIMRLAFNCGYYGVGYYGFRFEGIPGLAKFDPFDYREILKYAGRLAREYND